MIQRKGRASKFQKIQTALEKAKSMSDVYRILDEGKFNLSNEEERQIARKWQILQEMLADYEKGVYAPSTQEVTA